MPTREVLNVVAGVWLGLGTYAQVQAQAQESLPSTAGRPGHQAAAHDEDPRRLVFPPDPKLPAGMSLQQTLDAAATPPPRDWPDTVFDERQTWFLRLDQLEWRDGEGGNDRLGWEGDFWAGGDYDRLWIKPEGEASFGGGDEGESETDVLYSRLVSPFWSLQGGVQYANTWSTTEADRDRWSAVVALQGLAPYMFEVDGSLYLSEDADLTASLEAEYDLRITQALVLQPRVELGLAAQDVAERDLAAGLTDATLDLRLRYELEREVAPYVGLRYAFLTGQTARRARAEGRDVEDFAVLFGVRLAF